MTLGLVLGAGGLVGIAHHVGVLRALEDETGLEEPDFGLVVGTSAGSAIGAYLRSGWTTLDLMNRASDLRSAAPGPAAAGAVDALRHGIGSAYIVARTTVRVPSVLSLPPVQMLRRAFPAGLVTMGDGGGMLERDLPRRWPERRLWLATYDLVSRRRVVLGRTGEPYVPLPNAVKASCAIPGVYPPVRAAGCVLVDGGAWSLTNVDLAALAGCTKVVCVAPMSYDPVRPPTGPERIVREFATRPLVRSLARLRRQGIEVALLAPGPAEVRAHGYNLMRATGLEHVAAVAYESTVEQIRHGVVGRHLAGFDRAKPPRPRRATAEAPTPGAARRQAQAARRRPDPPAAATGFSVPAR